MRSRFNWGEAYFTGAANLKIAQLRSNFIKEVAMRVLLPNNLQLIYSMIIFIVERKIELSKVNTESAEIYLSARMMFRDTIVKCIRHRENVWTKSKYVDVLTDTQQLPTRLQSGVWCKNLKDNSGDGFSFKKTNPGCNLVLRSILHGGSFC
jgi:hypothetical protein